MTGTFEIPACSRGIYAPHQPIRRVDVAGSCRSTAGIDPSRGDGPCRSDRNSPVPGRDRPSAHRAAGHPRIHRGLRQLGQLQLRHPVGAVPRMLAGGCLRPESVLAGDRTRRDGLRRIRGDRIGQSGRLPARRAVHGHRSALHIVGVAGGLRLVLHGVQLLPERDGRQHPEERHDRPPALGDGQFRIRVQSEPAQRRHPGAVRRGLPSHPRRHLQRRDGDELAAADPADHRRRRAPVRPGGRLPDQPAQCARRGELTVRLRLRAPRGPLGIADSARPVPGFDVLPDRHRNPSDVATADDRAVAGAVAGDHAGSSDAGSGGDRLRPHHQPRRTDPGQVPLHPQPVHRRRRFLDRDPERMGQRNRLHHRRSRQPSVPHHPGRTVRSWWTAGERGRDRPLRTAHATARPGQSSRRLRDSSRRPRRSG